MDWLDKMNGAMDYIEEHLDSEIDFQNAAQAACCSVYHFQRMFSFIADVPLSEYIRRRRLTMAAFELQNTGAKVIDLALKYGYESSESFSRAFHRLHGIPPAAARKKGAVLKAYPRLSFHISIKGEREMVYRIEEKQAFGVFGHKLETTVIDGKCYREIPAFWEACAHDGRFDALLKAAGKKPGELIDAGITYEHSPNGAMSYMIACVKQPGNCTGGYEELTIPKQTWAIFEVDWKGPEDDGSLHETWRRIYAEWFPTAGVEHADCDFDLEMYFGDNSTGCGVEIWIPVVKAK